MSDTDIRKLALKENRIIITKDSYFYNNHFKFAKMPPNLDLRIGNISNKDLIALLKNNLSSIISALEKDARLIMVEVSNIYILN
jgi:predicted nuclease of predicted toxin-antitoxin system